MRRLSSCLSWVDRVSNPAIEPGSAGKSRFLARFSGSSFAHTRANARPVSGLLQCALSKRRRMRAHRGPVRTKERRVHLSAVAVISPGNTGGPEILANDRLAVGVEIPFFDLVPLRIIGAGDARGAKALAFCRTTVVIEISFDDFQSTIVVRSRIRRGAGCPDRLCGPAGGVTFGFHRHESAMKSRPATDRKADDCIESSGYSSSLEKWPLEAK